MLQKEIKVGGVYVAKVSDKLTAVKVESIEETPGHKNRKASTRYRCRNQATGRPIVVKSAAKFRHEVPQVKKDTGGLKPSVPAPATTTAPEPLKPSTIHCTCTPRVKIGQCPKCNGWAVVKPLSAETLRAELNKLVPVVKVNIPLPPINPFDDDVPEKEGEQSPDPTLTSTAPRQSRATSTGGNTPSSPVKPFRKWTADALAKLAKEGEKRSDPSQAGHLKNSESSATMSRTTSHTGTKEPSTGPSDQESRSPRPSSSIASPRTTNSTPQQVSANVKSASGLGSILKGRSKPAAPHVVVRAFAGTGKTFTQIVGVAWAFGQEVWGTVVERMGFEPVPSDEQKAVWEAMALSRGSVKTITYCAFNKSIVTEFSDKWGWLVELLRTVDVQLEFATVNSLGHKSCTGAFGNRLNVTEYHTENILAELLGLDGRGLKRHYPVLAKQVSELVALCKLTLAGYEEGRPFNPENVTPFELDALIDHYGLEVQGPREDLYTRTLQVLTRCFNTQDVREIDYNDQNWLPVVSGLPIAQSDLLLVDEGQDLPRCKQEFVRRMGKRIVLVGDVKQAIYGFAGADVDSIPRMEKLLGILTCPRCWHNDKWQSDCAACKGTGYVGGSRLQLTETRRCGRAIVEEAQKIVPDFKAHPDNGQGIVRTESVETYHTRVEDKDMVLCRVNAPLISQALRFIKSGRKAIVRGRDFGKQLTKFVDDMNAATIVELIVKVEAWLTTESNKERAKRNPNDARLLALQDRHDCIIAFTDGATSVNDVRDKIDLVFAGKQCPKCKLNFREDADECYRCKVKLIKPDGVLFSSIHKAKGLEADRVFFLLLKGAECPHPMARSEWQIGQEWNCKYIAITRARDELVYVVSPGKN